MVSVLLTLASFSLHAQSTLLEVRAGSASAAPAQLTEFLGLCFFSADDGTNGRELWRSDGTVAGTTLVADLRAGLLPSGPQQLTVSGGKLFFTADNGVNGRELWVTTDGINLTMVSDIRAGALGSIPLWLQPWQGKVWFSADDGVNGRELWCSDGTAGGTVLVKDIDPTVPGGVPAGSTPGELTPVGTQLFFAATTANGRELWVTDGTTAGTTEVLDIVTGSTGSNPFSLTALGTLVLFTADDGVVGRELWKSDGTGAGTAMVADILPGSSGSNPTELVDLSGTLLFAAEGSIGNQELWTSDGTSAGTMLLTEINTSGSATPRQLSVVGDTLYFWANNGATGLELWRTAGAPTTTVLVQDINSGSGSSLSIGGNLRFLGGPCPYFFVADNGSNGHELWRTDGSAANTALVEDIDSGAGSSYPLHFTTAGGLVFFTAYSSTTGTELRVIDPTPWISPPTILVDPVSYSGCEGASHDLSVVASGCALTYQWFKDGSPVSGATTSILSFASLTAADDGDYTVEVTSGATTVTSAIATIAVTDMTPPVLTVPPAISLPCDGNYDPTVAGQATATDNCDPNPSVSFSDSVAPGACTGASIVTRTWTAMDATGNTTSDTQIITLSDTTPPMLLGTPLPTLAVQCTQDIPAPPVVTATDNCDPGTLSINFGEMSDGLSCPETITRTWDCTDGCGNLATFTQVITVHDTTDPVLSVPAAITLPCEGPYDPTVAGQATATDNCDPNPMVTFTDVISAGPCPGESVVTRTWSASDACGNMIMGNQIITLEDTTAPILVGTPAATLTVSCPQDVPTPPTVTATDNCDPGTLTVNFNEMTDGLSCPETIMRTWDCTDACGNLATFTQVITVHDTTDPVLTVPANITVNCADPGIGSPNSPDPALTGFATATDGCTGVLSMAPMGTPGISYSDAVVSTCPLVLQRTWSAQDDCGNVAQAPQMITVTDTVAPTWDTFPADITITLPPGACTTDPIMWALPTASDDCNTVTITPSPALTPGVTLGEGVHVITYTASDGCNMISAPFTITVESEYIVTATESIPANSQDLLVQDVGNTTGALTPDGNPDALVLTSTSVLLFMGDGAGGFLTGPTVDLSLHTGWMSGDTAVVFTTGEFGGGQGNDLAAGVRNAGGDRILVILSTGGTYSAGATLTVPGADVLTDLAATDLNGTTPDDLVASTNGTTQDCISWIDLAPATSLGIPVGAAPQSVALADLNDDGDMDIALASGASGITLYDNDGMGTFTQVGSVATTNPATKLIVGDLNADGRGADLIALCDGGAAMPGTLEPFLHDPANVLVPIDPLAFSPAAISDTHPGSKDLALGDLRRDTVVGTMGKLIPRQDVLVASTEGTSGGQLFMAFDGQDPTTADAPLGSGAFAELHTCSLGLMSDAVFLVDMNGDNLQDVVMLSIAEGTLRVATATLQPLVDIYGGACAGTLGYPIIQLGNPSVPQYNVPVTGAIIQVKLFNALPGANAALLVGGTDSIVVTDPATMDSCELNLLAPISILVQLPVGVTGGDPASLTIPILVPPGIEGVEFSFQWVFPDPVGAFSGWAASPGMRLRVAAP